MATYYTVTGNPPNQTRGISTSIRAEFVLIQAGFAAIPVTSQNWSGTQDFTAGTVKVPTLSYGATGNYAVSVDMLNNAVFASTTLPGQTSNAGRFLKTNGTSPYWGDPLVIRSARTSNTILAPSDIGGLIDVTSGTFTQTFTAAATLGSGWYVYYRNSGTGQITIPSSDGRTNWFMYPGETRLFQCDGTNFYSIVLHGYALKDGLSGTWIKPPGYKAHTVRLLGAGAGGGGGGGGAAGGGSAGPTGGGGGSGGASGGQGQVAQKKIADANLANSVSYVVGAASNGGAGGAGGTGTTNTAGAAGIAGTSSSVGGSTSFGSPGDNSYMVAAGGAIGKNGNGGQVQTAGTAPGGAAVTGSVATTGSNSYDAITIFNTQAAISSVAGSNATTSDGAAGGNGANGTPALDAPTSGTTGGVGGAAQTTTLVVGNSAAAPTGAALPGQGGAGGGGGGASHSAATTSANGGAGSTGAAGGPGQIEIYGEV